MLLNQIDETLPYILYENVLATCKQQMSTDTHTFFFSCQYVGFKPYFHTVYRWAIKRTSPSITSTACPRNQCCTLSHQHYQLVKQDSPYYCTNLLPIYLIVTVTTRPASNLLNCKLLRSSARFPSFSCTEAICSLQ